MPPDIQISHLKTLIAIDEEGSFSAAAARLGRTQSAVTQQMKNLEHIVGTPLFVVNGRKRELSEAGLILLTNGHQIISACNQAVASARNNINAGTIRIGAPQEIAEVLLPDVLKVFATRWPHVRLNVHADRSPNLMTLLENGQLDVALSTRRSSNYNSILLMKVPAVWIAAENWQREPNTPIPLVLSDEPSLFRRIALAALELQGQAFVEKLTSSSLMGVRLAVAAELGVTVRTKSAFFSETKLLGEKDGFPSLPNISYYLHQSRQMQSEECNDLVRILKEQANV